MRMHRCTDVFCCLIVLILVVLSTFGRAENDNGTHLRRCNISDASGNCGKNQRCRVSSNGQQWCDCIRGFHFVNDECVKITPVIEASTTTLKPEYKPESDTGGSSVAAGLLIPTFLIVGGVLLYFGARRYKWLQRFRQYRHNRYGNVLVTRDDDDDDDPPIA